MPFYKRDGASLLDGQTVAGPSYFLTEETRQQFTYPVDGWYWFASLDTAMVGLALGPDEVTIRQAELAMNETTWNGTNLLAQVNAIVAGAGQEAQITWRRSTTVQRSNALFQQVVQLLGLTESKVNELFALAKTK